jgi:hypothetical protein
MVARTRPPRWSRSGRGERRKCYYADGKHAVAEIAALFMLSRVTISHPLAATSGIQSGSSTSGLAMEHGGLGRL